MMSPAAKRPPGATPQRATLPSVIVRPSFGMTKSVAAITPPPVADDSAPGESRRALLQKSAAALVCVLGVEDQADHALLVRQSRRQRHVCAVRQCTLEQTENERAFRGDFRGHRPRFGEHLLARYDLVRESNCDCFRRRNLLAGEHDL